MIDVVDFSKCVGLLPKREFVPQNTWLTIGDVLLLKGKFKVGKSLFVQQLMTAVATGRTWFNEYVGQIKTYGVFCEDDEAKLLHRQYTINEFYKLNMKSPDLINNVRLLPRTVGDNLLMVFDDKNIGRLTPYFEELLKDLQSFQPKLVVLDSASDLFWGNEDNQLHFRQFVQNCCARIARRVNCAVLLCKHDNSEEVEDRDDKVWHLIKRESISEKREFYGYGIRRLECYKDKIFHSVGDYFI
ncbi:MAG: AAA family ATPase [Rickettsiales bacterium]|jgi:RecA-family ATPase|nr:AAA family ATPase [Rickettsiales bacterium]MDR1260869.1 AAA family ATPase [Rickettsiales bacterium]